jgi:hypothetical protein
MIALFLVLLLLSRSSFELTDHVDLIELNHHYDACGNHSFDQLIFWEIDPATERFWVRAWKMQNDVDAHPLEANGIYQIRITNNGSTTLVQSRMFRESWTQIDPERANKRLHPEGDRIELAKHCERPK